MKRCPDRRVGLILVGRWSTQKSREKRSRKDSFGARVLVGSVLQFGDTRLYRDVTEEKIGTFFGVPWEEEASVTEVDKTPSRYERCGRVSTDTGTGRVDGGGVGGTGRPDPVQDSRKQSGLFLGDMYRGQRRQ